MIPINDRFIPRRARISCSGSGRKAQKGKELFLFAKKGSKEAPAERGEKEHPGRA